MALPIIVYSGETDSAEAMNTMRNLQRAHVGTPRLLLREGVWRCISQDFTSYADAAAMRARFLPPINKNKVIRDDSYIRSKPLWCPGMVLAKDHYECR